MKNNYIKVHKKNSQICIARYCHTSKSVSFGVNGYTDIRHYDAFTYSILNFLIPGKCFKTNK